MATADKTGKWRPINHETSHDLGTKSGKRIKKDNFMTSLEYNTDDVRRETNKEFQMGYDKLRPTFRNI